MSPENPRSRRRILKEAAGSAVVLTIGPAGLSAALAQGEPDYLREAKPAREARMEWWRDARFGMFIHWGVYAVPAGVYQGRDIEDIGEWIQARANIPAEEYSKYPPQFNPVKFDAREWVSTAREAGMKYLVITSKHHDGFALFDSKQSDWDIVDATPYGRVVLGPLSRV